MYKTIIFFLISLSLFSESFQIDNNEIVFEKSITTENRFLNIDRVIGENVYFSDKKSILSINLLTGETTEIKHAVYDVIWIPRLDNKSLLYTDGYYDLSALHLQMPDLSDRNISSELYSYNVEFKEFEDNPLVRDMYWLDDNIFYISIYDNMINNLHTHAIYLCSTRDNQRFEYIDDNVLSMFVSHNHQLYYVKYENEIAYLYLYYDKVSELLKQFEEGYFIECSFKNGLILKNERNDFFYLNLDNSELENIEIDGLSKVRISEKNLFIFKNEGTILRYSF